MWSHSETPYKVLGINEQATREEIKTAWRALATRYHPDKEGGDATRMALINAAYAVLYDRKTKMAYDRYERPQCPTCKGTRNVMRMTGFKRVKTRCPDCK